MLLSEAMCCLFAAPVRLAVGALGIFDPHLDPLRQSRVTIPELRASRRHCCRKAFTRHAFHFAIIDHMF